MGRHAHRRAAPDSGEADLTAGRGSGYRGNLAWFGRVGECSLRNILTSDILRMRFGEERMALQPTTLLAIALKDEARRRVEVGTFFGHLAYASVIAHGKAASSIQDESCS